VLSRSRCPLRSSIFPPKTTANSGDLKSIYRSSSRIKLGIIPYRRMKKREEDLDEVYGDKREKGADCYEFSKVTLYSYNRE
jgi:hypothetical protein